MLDPNKVDDEGASALHFVVTLDFNEVAMWLMQNGFDFLKQNSFGDTPYDIASRRKNHFLMRYMEKRYALQHLDIVALDE